MLFYDKSVTKRYHEKYTKDTTEIHSDGEQVHLSFDPMRISLYDKSEEVLSL